MVGKLWLMNDREYESNLSGIRKMQSQVGTRALYLLSNLSSTPLLNQV